MALLFDRYCNGKMQPTGGQRPRLDDNQFRQANIIGKMRVYTVLSFTERISTGTRRKRASFEIQHNVILLVTSKVISLFVRPLEKGIAL